MGATLVVSDPPHGYVDVEAAAGLLQLDVFTAGLKVRFGAPEVMSVSDAETAADFAAAMRGVGFSVGTLVGARLADLPWPEPSDSIALDTTSMRATIGNESVTVPYDADVVGVRCVPPPGFSAERPIDLDRAVASRHGPTIAEALQWTDSLDLYFTNQGSLRRVSIVPKLLRLDMAPVMQQIEKRFKALRLDARLEGVHPRQRYVPGSRYERADRRRYSFGTKMLREALESISPELGMLTQYELGSRLAYLLNPLEVAADPS
jgi:hypothetical protein